MNTAIAEGQRFRVVVLNTSLAFVFLLATVWARSGPPVEQKSAGEDARATQETTEPQEQKISPQEAEKLFRSVDEILSFASKDTLFPIKHEVKRRLVSRDEVADYVTKNTIRGRGR